MLELFSVGFVHFTLVDAIDIVIVTAVLYQLYKSLRNTIAAQIFLGIVVVLAIYFIAEAVHIRALKWLLGSMSDVWLIGFIILFQPELRRLILVFAQLPIFSIFTSSRVSETVDEVIGAVEELANKHIGALMVFTRSRNLEMTIETGVPIRGELSKELLVSIFNTKSPLHDGAVIIENGKIEAAGCILPLSSSTKQEHKQLGTRHRAGLGITEQADVVVVIVSEETGRITIAEQGVLLPNLDIKSVETILRQRLSNDWRERESDSPAFA